MYDRRGRNGSGRAVSRGCRLARQDRPFNSSRLPDRGGRAEAAVPGDPAFREPRMVDTESPDQPEPPYVAVTLIDPELVWNEEDAIRLIAWYQE